MRDSILTTSQAAHELGVPATTLRRWTNRGQVPFLMTPGGQRRFTHEQIRQIKKQVLTTSEAAAELSVSRTTLRRWANQDLVPYTSDSNGRRWFTWENIQHIKAQMRHQPVTDRLRDAA